MGSTGGALTARDLPFLHDVHVPPEEVDAAISVPAAYIIFYRDPCSASLNEDDNHTIKLVGNAQRKAVTLAKTCENTNELRECRAPKDWSILALQNSRTGKSHYLVICKCPPHYRLEGPLAHDQPTYAGLPGINVYGMLCVPPESYAPKPLKTPSSQSIYNKWKVRPAPVSSYRDTEYRSFQNATMASDDVE
ncbi:AAEL001026-PA [Aedes aegypti]|uniref:AAEL001026-PA n=1 Tax=Aedes aegypti TaxID=7159 RepID=Q17ME4_AEDAE|nr:AAEL001026-PA [Aedes aegypti]